MMDIPHPTRHALLIFLDGIGLGAPDPAVNPFAAAHLPTLTAFTAGRPWLADVGEHAGPVVVGGKPFETLFRPVDPRMGVAGRPQSASGQAAIVTGRPVPALLGEHYGPRPNAAIRALLDAGTLFTHVREAGGTAALLEGYPPGWHAVINSGKRLPSSYQYAAIAAGLPIAGEREIRSGDALAVDWTGEGWRRELGYRDTPVYTPAEGGRRMAELARRVTFSFFPHWYTDVVGHRAGMREGVGLLELFDQVLAGALAAWDPDDLIVVTSDHGNLEDLSHGKHTEADVPLLVIGREAARFAGARTLADLAGPLFAALYPHRPEPAPRDAVRGSGAR
jgi:hypothetical protein